MKNSEILERIDSYQTFQAYADDRSFFIAIDDWVPFICLAVHNGSNLRESLRDKISLTKQERWYEEDPETGQFITSLPIRLIAHDSRYEYDLNRDEEHCIYDMAWGKEVWKETLSQEDKAASLKKYRFFHEVLQALVSQIVSRFGGVIVYDIHSYNYKRHDYETPVFNLGTKNINVKKYGKYIDTWAEELEKIQLPHLQTTFKQNQVFFGNGHILKFLTREFKNTLVLSTEIKKIYCDETGGDQYPEVIDAIKLGLKNAIITHAKQFVNGVTRIHITKKYQLLSSEIDENVLYVDNKIYNVSRSIELLEYLEPINNYQQKKRFFTSHFRSEPQFRYRPLTIDVKVYKKELYSLPIEKIRDIHLQTLYQDTIDQQVALMDMLSVRGQKKFFYNSLKYFGEPDEHDIINADWILRCPEIEELSIEEPITIPEAIAVLDGYIASYRFPAKVEVVKNMAAKAMFVMSKKRVRLNGSATFTRNEIEALGHHEIGVHLLTTMNAQKQPLKVLQVGFPFYSYTQEGLAVLCEYLAGYLSLKRLQELALRTIAVRSMVTGNDFVHTFQLITDQYNVGFEKAYSITLRVYRGGGLTKDFLYLKGLKEMLHLHEKSPQLKNLLIGKTSVLYLDLIRELIDREILSPPQYICDSLLRDKPVKPILDYIIKGLKWNNDDKIKN